MKNPLVIDIKTPFLSTDVFHCIPGNNEIVRALLLNSLIHIDCANELQKNETEIMRLRGRAHCVIDLSVAAFSHK